MNVEINIDWFKNNMLLFFEKYQILFRYFENGDFGDDERFEFQGNGKGGSVDFWSSGWLSIHVYSYSEELELFNILLEPDEIFEKIKAFKKLEELIK